MKNTFLLKLFHYLFIPVWIVTLIAVVWCTGAVYFLPWISSSTWKGILALLFFLGMLALLILSFWKSFFLLIVTGICFLFITLWLLFLYPSGEKNWDPPFKTVPKALFSEDGKSVTIENIRDFHYRTEKDYDIRYKTETYFFDDLETMDYSITHWDDMEYFGHIMLSFRFKGGKYLAISPEARLVRGDMYHLIDGIYRNYELIFIVATEEDVFQLRTHHRRYEKEEVLLYPTNLKHDDIVFIFKDLLKRGNGLKEKPEFYNGFTYNCLSSMAATAEKLGYNFCSGILRGTFNGLSDRRGFRNGFLKKDDPAESFRDYRKRHSINQYVEKLDNPQDFSILIRPWLNKQKEK